MLKDYDSNIEYYVMKGIIDVCKKDITVVRSCFNISSDTWLCAYDGRNRYGCIPRREAVLCFR